MDNVVGTESAAGSGGGMGQEMPSLKSLLQLKKKYDAPGVDELPEGYKTNTDKERLYLWAANNFEQQIKHKYPNLTPLCLTCKNECDTEKLVMTFIKVLLPPFNRFLRVHCTDDVVID